MRQSKEKNTATLSGDLTPHHWGLTKKHAAILTPIMTCQSKHIVLQLPVSSSIQPCLHFSKLAVLWHFLRNYRLWKVLMSFLTYSTNYSSRLFSHNCTIYSEENKYLNTLQFCKFSNLEIMEGSEIVICKKVHVHCKKNPKSQYMIF